jgi:hypothetical protein
MWGNRRQGGEVCFTLPCGLSSFWADRSVESIDPEEIARLERENTELRQQLDMLFDDIGS